MVFSSIPSPDDISLKTFQSLVARYPEVIQAVSDSKPTKPGQQSLAELDVFRYTTAPARFGLDGDAPEAMTLEDAKTLVAWKLRHGKFRPTLMGLVSSNDAKTVDKVVAEAVAVYKAACKQGNPAGTPLPALKILCRLRGIGPATASLLLAVHDPQRVVFFADEAYAWLCGGGGGGGGGAAQPTMPSKYNEKEYAALHAATAVLQARLGKTVAAVDVEKAAFVLFKGGDGVKDKAATREPSKTAAARGSSKVAQPDDSVSTTKRKRTANDAAGEPPAAGLRRSQRARRT